MSHRAPLDDLWSSLPAWLPSQRWFGGKGHRIRTVQVGDYGVLEGEPEVLLALIDVGYADAPSERYFVPVRPWPGGRLGGFEDALSDGGAGLALLGAVDRGERVATAGGGTIAFERGPAFGELRGSVGASSARPLGAEQSNTSLVFGDSIIMKAFRRVPDGPNPDLEVPRFLGTRTAFRSVPKLVGSIEYQGPTGRGGSLAILQEFVRSHGDGWGYTLRALAAGELQPDAPYLEQVRALGRVTAELHLALASVWDDPAFAPEPVAAADLDAWRSGAVGQIERSLAALRRALASNRLPAELAELVLRGETPLRRRADEIAALRPGALSKTRFHGDFHLGQVLRTADGWIVLDFEGEPLRSLKERRAKHCPLKDVAGMLRSFSYARLAASRDSGGAGPAPDAELLAAWERAARAAYLTAYLEWTGPEAVFLPSDGEATRLLLEAFELEKAAYELEYELNNRPAWVELPLSYLADAVG
jgi:trehalose synthase-fused probable maltokinase